MKTPNEKIGDLEKQVNDLTKIVEELGTNNLNYGIEIDGLVTCLMDALQIINDYCPVDQNIKDLVNRANSIMDSKFILTN